MKQKQSQALRRKAGLASRESDDDVSRTELQDALESERISVANDIHDLLLPLIFTAHAAVDKEIRDGSESVALQHARDLLQQAQTLGRDLIAMAMPGIDVCHQWLPACKLSIAHLNQSAREIVSWQIDPEFVFAKQDVAIAFLRIAGEAIRNAVKHSGATKISVCLRATENSQALLEVSDNGCGFRQESIERESHGLKSIRFRANAIAANLYIETAPDTGTTLKLSASNAAD